jgi:Coenzyme PQQ synthesis protein D (PqqD)
MKTSEQAFPQSRTEGLVTREMPDEVLVYDLNSHKAHCLNLTAAMVWRHCDGKTAVPELTAQLQREFNPSLDEAVVWLAVKQLSKANLLKERVIPPASSPRLGRRAALRIGTAIAVPIVMSIIAPTAQAACTGGRAPGAFCSLIFSNGTVPCTACLSACCAVVPGSGTRCVPAMAIPTGTACDRGCQCVSGMCSAGTCV